mmetsp:Transcript_12017/g.16630  ORF Transcript_12017/g.16630 Transcript_12017/m.16630 type:complete len:163 (+) Transcript_12017:122-610(+)
MGKHPVDAYRKSQRKKELRKNKQQHPKKKEPKSEVDRVKAQIAKIDALGPNIDKGLKKKKKKLEKKYQQLAHQQFEQAGISASMGRAILAHERLEAQNAQFENEFYYPPTINVAVPPIPRHNDSQSNLVDPDIDLSTVQIPVDPAPLPPLPPGPPIMIPQSV